MMIFEIIALWVVIIGSGIGVFGAMYYAWQFTIWLKVQLDIFFGNF